MIETLHEHIVHMLHTHDGAYVAMMCLWHGTAKVLASFIDVIGLDVSLQTLLELSDLVLKN
jgi:hypothetical protein